MNIGLIPIFFLAGRAVELKPAQGMFWNTLGVAQYRAGQFSDALSSLERSHELLAAEGMAFNGSFLAMSHHELGQHEEARDWLAKSVKWMQDNDPDNEELIRFRTEAEEMIGAIKSAEVKRPPAPELSEPITEQ